MTADVVVVGSGASSVHFTLSLLRKGRKVLMLDIGRQGNAPPSPGASFGSLKDELEDPSAYFLGSRFDGVLLPGYDKEYYGIPPSKDYVFDTIPGFEFAAQGFNPLFSFARGGLAETWTGGCYPLNDGELAGFPFSYRELGPHYEEVAKRIGVSGDKDDLAQFMPLQDSLLPPLRLDRHSQKLIDVYQRKRERVRSKAGAYVGRTRVATLSRPLGSRQACDYLGRCLWGCPRNALYTPSQTLRECATYSGFTYVPGMRVDYFKLGQGGRVRSVVASRVDDNVEEEFPVECLALAAGALPSTKIFLRSVQRESGNRVTLRGLMDNRQVLVPFVNLGMIGAPFSNESYQYHLLGMGIESKDPGEYIHCQITTLKTAMLHPIIQGLPFDMRTSTFVTRAMHAALGIVNVNFRDTRRNVNCVTLAEGPADRPPRLEIHYEPSADEPARMNEGLRKVRKTLRMLGCIVPPGMSHVRPMGASVHYAGTLPMTSESAPFTTTEFCQSRDFSNLFMVDGSTFPFLPAKNITFTLMANAVRVAETAF